MAGPPASSAVLSSWVVGSSCRPLFFHSSLFPFFHCLPPPDFFSSLLLYFLKYLSVLSYYFLLLATIIIIFTLVFYTRSAGLSVLYSISPSASPLLVSSRHSARGSSSFFSFLFLFLIIPLDFLIFLSAFLSFFLPSCSTFPFSSPSYFSLLFFLFFFFFWLSFIPTVSWAVLRWAKLDRPASSCFPLRDRVMLASSV